MKDTESSGEQSGQYNMQPYHQNMASALDFYAAAMSKGNTEGDMQKLLTARAVENARTDALRVKRTTTAASHRLMDKAELTEFLYGQRLFVEEDEESDYQKHCGEPVLISESPYEDSWPSHMQASQIQEDGPEEDSSLYADHHSSHSESELETDTGIEPPHPNILDPLGPPTKQEVLLAATFHSRQKEHLAAKLKLQEKKRPAATSLSELEQPPKKKARITQKSKSVPASPETSAVKLASRSCSNPQSSFSSNDIPTGYTKFQWKCSYKRIDSTIRTAVRKDWKSHVSDTVTEAEAKVIAAKKGAEAVANMGYTQIRKRALEADEKKAATLGVTVVEWLAKWSANLEKVRETREAKGADTRETISDEDTP